MNPTEQITGQTNELKKEERPALLELRQIEKSFGDTRVLKGIDLTVGEGEFVTLLGSSGCGKTTTLRIIAGLEEPDGGQVLLEGRDMRGWGPEKRNVNTVFQNYALFPHMNVFQNIAYGLKIRKVAREEIRRRVTDMLTLVQLEGFEKRMPSQMSGGQRQRVAIARALVNNPRVLLLDEPLGALDLQLRRQMQLELKRLQKKLGITFIYITHDQEEAINMSDKIVVIREGLVEQAGTPARIYDDPRTSYVARFVGSANILTGKVLSVRNQEGVLEHVSGRAGFRTSGRPVKEGEQATVAVRGETIRIWPQKHQDYGLAGIITEKSFVGGMLRITVVLGDGTEMTVSRHGINFDYDAGQEVRLEWDQTAAVLVDREEGQPGKWGSSGHMDKEGRQ